MCCCFLVVFIFPSLHSKMSTRRRSVLCRQCRPCKSGCFLWTPADTILLSLLLVSLIVLVLVLVYIVIPYRETSHFVKTTCLVANIETLGEEYCTDCYTADTGASRKRRSSSLDNNSNINRSNSPYYRSSYSLRTQPAISSFSNRDAQLSTKFRKRRAVCFDSDSPSSFPCVRVSVNYTISSSETTSEWSTGVLHFTVEDVYKYPQVRE